MEISEGLGAVPMKNFSRGKGNSRKNCKQGTKLTDTNFQSPLRKNNCNPGQKQRKR